MDETLVIPAGPTLADLLSMAVFHRSRLNLITSKVIGAAIEVHRQMGPGLLESIYQRCLCHELSERELAFEAHTTIDVMYKGQSLDGGLKLDLFVESSWWLN
jgi:GxxExxY protein